MKSPLTFLLFLGLSSAALAQRRPADSSFFVEMKDGNRLYTNKLRLKETKAAEKYLLLADSQSISIDQVTRFHIRQGTYLALPGSAGTDLYKIQSEGPRISYYSQTYIDPRYAGDSGYTANTNYFYRKEGQSLMTPANYYSLQKAFSDNPASLHQLRVARSNVYLGWGLVIASSITSIIGIIETAKSNMNTTQPTLPSSPPPTLNPFQPPPPAPSLPATPHHPLSPAVYIGAAGVIAGFTIALTSSHHVKRAFDLYNGLP